jgi:hypothetical protein
MNEVAVVGKVHGISCAEGQDGPYNISIAKVQFEGALGVFPIRMSKVQAAEFHLGQTCIIRIKEDVTE